MRIKALALAILATASLSACATNETHHASAEKKPAAQAHVSSPAKTEKKVEAVKAESKYNDLYVSYRDGRAYIFYDQKGYFDFLSLGETPFQFSQIGAGPKGETLVYSLTKADKKKRSGIPSVDMMNGKAAADELFYGEIDHEGRIYVFDSFKEMQAYMQVGEAPYRYTDIGAGPNGETVVYALQKSKKKQKPVDMIAKFKAVHSK